MSDYITLMGAEDVRRAASTISEAADKMARVAGEFGYVADRLIRALDEHATRIEQASAEK
jgi:hypothetical protein